jgi:D,D-heptose 1,7-bisphosphate phosphatase
VIKQAVILAGGKGTRLRSRLKDRPKPLVDILGVSLLERQILALKKNSIKKILLLVNYKYREIVSFCKKNKYWDLDINIKLDEDGKVGTAGALLSSINFLDDIFLVVYGDTLFNIDIERFQKFHNLNKADITLYLHPNDHPYDSDLVEINDENRVTKFHNYPHNENVFYPNLVNAAFYIINKNSIVNINLEIGEFDLAKHLFPKLIYKLKILGYNSSEYIKDCGTPERLDKCEFDLKNGLVENSSLKLKQKAVFIDRDGTINFENGFISSPKQIKLYNFVASSIFNLKNEGFLVFLITNQPVIARGECSIETLNQIHWKIEKSLSKSKTFFDKIYYCPHHPDSGFPGEVKYLKIKCNCRKPENGMIEKAIKEYNIDREKSWFIGDSTADLAASFKSKVKSILVKTGNAGRDNKYNYKPNYISENLEEASKLIINRQQ